MLGVNLDASPIVLGVLLLLVIASLSSWAVIVLKARELGRAERSTQRFIDAYVEQPADAVYGVAKATDSSPLSNVYSAGYREMTRLAKAATPSGELRPDQVEAVVQRLIWIQTGERHRLERGLAYLATVGSSAPFVGLFGTVVGIMNSFREIGLSGTASLAVVAPGISEALVATAVGLGAAIPAVIAYNYQGARLNRLFERLDDFRQEYSDSLRRTASRAA